MYFFTADEHYGHANIIKYCNRPFSNIHEMDAEIIKRHNEVVGVNDTVIHAGDFCWPSDPFEATEFIEQLKGNHVFLIGSHDRWMRQSAENHKHIWEKNIDGQIVVVCHYAMRVWPRSHYNSWQLFGHTHGRLEPKGKQHDIGVDNTNFYPVSFDYIKSMMAGRDDNFDLIKVD